ncbi:MAG TPA: hypothetical protein VIK72_08060 [Clostridiaceae bacterium]
MWFDKIMEDCKEALIISKKNKGIFIPIFIQLGFSFFLGILIAIIVIVSIIGTFRVNFGSFNTWQSFVSILPVAIGFVIIISLIAIIFNALLEVGSISLYKAAVEGIKPTSKHFFQGIKNYFLKVFGGSMFLGIVGLILSPIIFALLILYTVIIGVLTAGWGMTFLSTILLVFFLPWPIIVVLDNISPIKAIGKSFVFGKKNFLALFIVLLAYTLLTRYLVSGLGIFVAAFGGWFLVGVLATYIKVVVILFYKRESETVVYK